MKVGRSVAIVFAFAVTFAFVFASYSVMAKSSAVENDESVPGMTAGGGGWVGPMDGSLADVKNTFSFLLFEKDWGMSSIMFKSRDLGMTFLSYNFTSITFKNDDNDLRWTADSTGLAMANGQNYLFHLTVTEAGQGVVEPGVRIAHQLLFEVELVSDPSVHFAWESKDLTGGTIWIHLE